MQSGNEVLTLSRRKVLAGLGTTGLMSVLSHKPLPANPSDESPGRLSVAIMSKFMQFLDLKEMSEAAAQIGFDGIDLCVRPGAHVLPERVEEDLPRAVAIMRKAGLQVPMITTDIVDAESPHAEPVLRTAGALGIGLYRWGGFTYNNQPGIISQLDALKPRVKGLDDLNRRHKVCAMYHTHSGQGQVGASIWDLWILLREFDPQSIAVNFDVGHATVEGGGGGWLHSARLILPLTRGLAIKDFSWGQDQNGKWVPKWRPLGKGMVDFRLFLQILRSARFSGPVQMHFEYPLGGVENGATVLTKERREVFAAMKTDLNTFRAWLREAGL